MNERTAKNAALSLLIARKINEGMDVKDALDAVLGDGTADKLISDVYHALRGEN